MTILLTGGTGFLGSNLVRRLVSEGYRVILLTRPVSDTWRINDLLGKVENFIIPATDLDKLFEEKRIDCVVHCATNYGRREMDITSMLESNLILPLRLLQLARKSGVRSFINTDTILDKRVNSYSLSKGQFKEWLLRFSDDISCVNVSLEHFYGPLDDRTKFVTFIIHSLLDNVETIPLTLGEQKRDFIYIDDVVEAFIRIIAQGDKLAKRFYGYEIGSGQTIEIRQFVRLVKSLTGNLTTNLDFGAIPYRDNEIMESAVDLAGVMHLGWTPVVPLEEGLRRTITVERELRG